MGMKAWRKQKSAGRYRNHRAARAAHKLGSLRAVPSQLVYKLINSVFKRDDAFDYFEKMVRYKPEEYLK